MKRTSLPLQRRAFIAGLGGTAVWPVVARGQERVRRIGVLMSVDANDPEMQGLVVALTQGLREATARPDRSESGFPRGSVGASLTH